MGADRSGLDTYRLGRIQRTHGAHRFTGASVEGEAASGDGGETVGVPGTGEGVGGSGAASTALMGW